MNIITLPNIGDITDAEVIEVLVAAGDALDAETPIIVIETDKASMDIPCPEAGTVAAVLVNVGDKVQEGSELIKLASQSGDAAEVVEEAEEESTLTSNDSVSSSTESWVTLPNLGDIAEAEVIEVSVSVGDTIDIDTPLIVVETDKASMDIPSTLAGKVTQIASSIGDKVKEGDQLVLVSVSDATPEAAPASPTTNEDQAPNVPVKAPVSAPPVRKAPDSRPHTPATNGKAHAGPAVRKLARKLGVDLSQVAGSGPRNRILKEDVQSYVKSALQNRDTIHSGSGLNLIPKPQVDFSQYGDIETVELSKINKLTGKNTHRSWVSIPHVTQFDEADITDLEHFRKSIKAEYAEKGVSVTLLPFVVKAVVSGLKELPRFNASLDDAEENLILKHYYNVGIAVDTPYGLVVPVVKEVDRKSITEIAIEITELATKAKNKKLSPADMQGGCFTISSLGHIGGTGFTPIINEPEVAILGLSKSSLKPIFDGNAFQPRLMLPLSLSYDHRVIDGVLAAKFTQHIADVLADARKMLL